MISQNNFSLKIIIQNLKDNEGILFSDFSLYKYMIKDNSNLISHFKIQNLKRKGNFEILELKDNKIFIIHFHNNDIIIIKDDNEKIKDILFNLLNEIISKLENKFKNEIYFLYDIKEPGFLIFGLEIKENHENKEYLSAIEINNEIIPIKIIQIFELVLVKIFIEDFENVFYKEIMENFKIKEI